jgi:hypothetical protein
MSSSDRSGHDRVEGVGSDDDVKVEQASALFDHPARAAGWLSIGRDSSLEPIQKWNLRRRLGG